MKEQLSVIGAEYVSVCNEHQIKNLVVHVFFFFFLCIYFMLFCQLGLKTCSSVGSSDLKVSYNGVQVKKRKETASIPEDSPPAEGRPASSSSLKLLPPVALTVTNSKLKCVCLEVGTISFIITCFSQ